LGRNRKKSVVKFVFTFIPAGFDPFRIEGGVSLMKRLFGFLAMAGLMMFAAPVERAQAVSLINPAAAAQTKYLSDDLVVEVRHRGGGFRGGFRGGGFRGGHIGRAHFGGGHRFVHRHRFVHHRPFIVRRHVWRPRPYIYPHYLYAQPRLFCRRVWTDFGPRRICRHRPWWV
jgi:hypothetical protein